MHCRLLGVASMRPPTLASRTFLSLLAAMLPTLPRSSAVSVRPSAVGAGRRQAGALRQAGPSAGGRRRRQSGGGGLHGPTQRGCGGLRRLKAPHLVPALLQRR